MCKTVPLVPTSPYASPCVIPALQLKASSSGPRTERADLPCGILSREVVRCHRALRSGQRRSRLGRVLRRRLPFKIIDGQVDIHFPRCRIRYLRPYNLTLKILRFHDHSSEHCMPCFGRPMKKMGHGSLLLFRTYFSRSSTRTQSIFQAKLLHHCLLP